MNTNSGKRSITLTREINLSEAGLFYIHEKDELFNLLNEIYGRLWTEGYYDPDCEATRKFARPLSDKMGRVNEILGFKK